MITASIVTYNADIDIIEGLITNIVDSGIDIIYIIDNSVKNNLEDVSKLSNKIIYIFNNANLGYGTAHNIAIKKAIAINSSYHVIINPDIVFKNNVIDELEKFMNENPDVGLVMPKILYPNGEIQYLCKLLPTPFDLLGRRFLPFKKFIAKKTQLYELRKTGYDKIMEVPSLSGCFMFIRTQILDCVEGFDERYFMYLEDIDLCRKIGQVSKTYFYPSVNVFHDYDKGSYKKFKLLKYHIVSAIKYFNKWGWFFDKERKKTNKSTIEKTNII